MAKLPRRKCAHKACRQWFHPVRDGQVVCSFECASAIGKEQTEKAREAAKQKAAQRQRTEEKAGRQRRKAKRESFKTKAQWDKEAQSAFNRYIRIRDEGKECVSCGNPLIGKSNYLTGSAIDASHYRSRGAASHLKFNVFNVHSACTRCNRQLSGNAVEYRIRLIERIGQERVERLESDNDPRRFDIPYLQRIKSIFTRKARALEKRRARRQEAA
ncbi:recombination protein NinG [Enterobacter cloacae subsp. cloacae]|uniref:recombination protein NinG n=1 Tax=Enterobacter cloacae TaxID=550 RepID=UPI001C5B3C47|nr:recombination protein NinG [Enterobacter cloacae]EJD7029797.1 recombination protein NinG [Enterobacter hormaechei]MBW4229151.1 recombination protein NinG [Enterobacter cloacae subsp. cloacae]